MPSELTKSLLPTILCFLKVPRTGHVKTRLARNIGSKSAVLIYRTLVENLLAQLPEKYPLEIYYTPENALKEMHGWLGNAYKYAPQSEGGLGTRLERAVVDAFENGAASVICIGGDCPKLNHIHIEQTAVALKADYDVVFGPSEDGGYYLIGLNAPYIELFRDISWSTVTTLEESLKQAAKLKLRILRLETLYDVDEIAELERAVDEGLLNIEFIRR